MDFDQLSEHTRVELIKMEMQLDDDNLTRGQRRRLQNKRNKLKAKIKTFQLTDNHHSKYDELKAEE